MLGYVRGLCNFPGGKPPWNDGAETPEGQLRPILNGNVCTPGNVQEIVLRDTEEKLNERHRTGLTIDQVWWHACGVLKGLRMAGFISSDKAESIRSKVAMTVNAYKAGEKQRREGGNILTESWDARPRDTREWQEYREDRPQTHPRYIGYYTCCCRHYSKLLVQRGYRWNGNHWVSRGNSLVYTVIKFMPGSYKPLEDKERKRNG